MSETVTPPPGFTLVAPSQSDSGNDLKPNPEAYQAVQEVSGLSRSASPPPGFKSVQPSHAQGNTATEQLYQDLTPQPRTSRTTSEDVQQGVAHGLVSGSASVLGLPADIWHMLKGENKAALTYGAQAVGLMTPEEGAKWRAEPPDEQQPMTSAWITKHVKNLAQSAGRDVSPARTVPGQYAETAASFIPMAAATPFMAEGTAAKALAKVPVAVARYGVLPAVTSETAGQLTKGTAAEPYARVAAAVAPEAVGQSFMAARRALSPVKGMMDGVTDTQRSEAQRLLDESRAAGAPLTVPEAVQQATGNGTRLGDIQRVVEQSPKGAAVLRPFMAQRPGQTEALGRSTFDQVAPAGADPYEIAPRVQGAAQQVLDTSPQTARLDAATQRLGPTTTAEEAGNVIRPELQGIYDRREGMRAALGDQDYATARAADYTANGQAANPVRVNPVIDHVDDLLASAKGGVAAALRRARGTLLTDGQPDMSVRGLSNARNAISDQISSATRAGNNQVARALLDVQGQLDYALERVPAYGQARRNFVAASEPLTPFAENTAPGRIIDQDQFGRNYTMPTERVAPTIERGGPAAADQFLAAAENSPRAREAFGQYYSQQLLGSATDATGRINPDILTNTLRQNEDMLRRFPEISTNLQRVGAARTALQRLEETPVGALAQTIGKTGKEQFAAQRNILFDPSASLAGGERTIANTVRAVAAHDPAAAQQFVRQHLEQAFNEAAQSNLPGANQWGGPKFAAVISGNSQQARNLEAAVRALPNGDVRWNALRKGLDIMEGMGARQPVGSQTAFNAQINKWMEQGHPAGEFLVNAASPGRWPSLVNSVYRHVMFDRNTGELARAFAQGSVADLRDIARLGSRSFQGQAAMIGVLARQGAMEESGANQP